MPGQYNNKELSPPKWRPLKGDVPNTPLYNDAAHSGGYDPRNRHTPTWGTWVVFNDGSLGKYDLNGKRIGHYSAGKYPPSWQEGPVSQKSVPPSSVKPGAVVRQSIPKSVLDAR